MTTGSSLHLRILAWLLIPLFLMAVVLLFEVYASANRSTAEIQDRMLLSHALAITEQALGTQGDLVYLDFVKQTSGGSVFYKVEGPDHAFVSGYSGLPTIPDPAILGDRRPHYFMARYRGEKVRVIALRTLVEGRLLNGWMTVYVAQLAGERERLVRQQVADSALRLSLLILVAGILGWFAVTQGLKPLTRLEKAIGRRSFDDLRPIVADMPRETTQLIHALNDLLARLAAAIGRNKRFIADASHQLRTPVAGLLAQTELALRKAGDADACAPIKNIHSNSRRMARLISQLLALAQADNMEAARQTFESVDLVPLAQRITAAMASQAPAAGMDLGFEAKTDSAVIQGNALMLEEMIQNLVDNACRYCPRGTVIDVRIEASQDQDKVCLSVADNGPGIPPQDRDRVFERFTRLREKEVAEGSGLGLAIAREVAQMHRGTLELSDGDDRRGLTVTVAFPRHGAEGIVQALRPSVS